MSNINIQQPSAPPRVATAALASAGPAAVAPVQVQQPQVIYVQQQPNNRNSDYYWRRKNNKQQQLLRWERNFHPYDHRDQGGNGGGYNYNQGGQRFHNNRGGEGGFDRYDNQRFNNNRGWEGGHNQGGGHRFDNRGEGGFGNHNYNNQGGHRFENENRGGGGDRGGAGGDRDVLYNQADVDRLVREALEADAARRERENPGGH